MTHYVPDNWVAMEVPGGHKIVAGWSGGYLNGNSWRVNSGIKSIVETDTSFLVHGFTGSVYECRKSSECIRMNMMYIVRGLEDRGAKVVDISTIVELYSSQHEDSKE